jgi:predicted glycoside hydrolase/deacetylase ChbG (UPF0249 family)
MSATRQLIVNADDLGQSEGINRAIFAAHQQGIVTSASLMTRGPAAPQAAAQSRELPDLGLGLHVDLGEWTYVNGQWVAVYEVAPCEDRRAVAAEIEHQLAEFHRLAGRAPTHLDSHQHVHRREPVRSVMIELAGRLGLPLRHFCDAVRYCGDFYGQTAEGQPLPERVGVENLVSIVRGLPPGINELACHPGYAQGLATMYREERELELRTLCDPRVRAALEAAGVQLRSFAGVIVSGAGRMKEA